MKRTKYFVYALMAAASVLLSSCTQKEEVYDKAQEESGNGFYFANNEQTSYILTDKGTLSIPLYRRNATGAATANLQVSGDALLSIPATVNFASGEKKADIQITYPFDDATVGVPYNYVIKVASDTTKYAPATLKFSAESPSQWVDFLNPKTGEPALVTFTQGWWGEIHTGYVHYIELENGVRHCVTYDEEGDISGAATPGPGFWGTGADYHLEFDWYTELQDANGYDYIHVYPSYVFTHSTYGADVYLYDDYEYYHTYRSNFNGSFLDYLSAASAPAYSYYDGNGGFYIFVSGYAMIGVGGWWQDDYDVVGIAEGFVRTTDYNNDIDDWKTVYTCDVNSGVFEESWSGQKLAYSQSDTTLFYLPDYFADGYGLAFKAETEAGATFTEETKFSDVDQQNTGISFLGTTLFANIKKGAVLAVDEETGYPTIALSLNIVGKVYDAENEAWNVTQEYGVFVDTLIVNGGAWYSADDISGLNKTTYTAFKWVSEASDFYEDGERYYTNYSYFTDDGEDESGSWLKLSGLSGINPTYIPDDNITVEWYNGYLYIEPQTLAEAFHYGGEVEDLYVRLFDSETPTGYTGGCYLIGGYIDDPDAGDIIALVDYPYDDVYVNGLWFRAAATGNLAINYDYVLYYSGSDDRAPLKPQSVGSIARRDVSPVKASENFEGRTDISMQTKVEPKAKPAVTRSFNHKPLTKGSKNFGETSISR